MNSHAHVVYVEPDEDFARVKLSHKTQTLIVEAVEGYVDHPEHRAPYEMASMDMPHHGLMRKSWLNLPMPQVLTRNGENSNSLTIIHSIVPYEPRKRARARDADEA